MRRAGGFTLIEMMVAGAIGVVVLSAGTLVTLKISQQYGQARLLSDMRRQAQLVLDQLGSELQQAGLGAPPGRRVDLPYDPFPPAVIGGTASAIAFIADVARPDSNFNGIGTISDTTSLLGLGGLSLLNEANGSCAAYLANTPCATNATSLLFDATTPSCGSSDTAPSCPWALNRYHSSEKVILTNLAGSWTEATLASGSLSTTLSGLRYLVVSPPISTSLWTVATSVVGGQVSTPDRIYYRVTSPGPAGVLERNQCWGTIGLPASAATLFSASCALGDETGTGWETLATGVTQFALTPVDAAGAVVGLPIADADLPRVARVQVALTLQRSTNGAPLVFSQQGEFALRSWRVP